MAGLRSAIGPGKPYWKSPLGSTRGLVRGDAAAGMEGMGGGGPVREGAPVVVVVVVVVMAGGVSFFVE